MSLVDSRGSSVAYNLLDLVVSFHLDAVLNLVLEACLFNLLHGLHTLLEVAELYLLQPTWHVFALLVFERVELEDVSKFLCKHNVL